MDLAISDKIKQLQREGVRPAERLAAQITRAGAAAQPALIELACNTGLLHGDEPACYAPIHALRLLGEVGSVEMITPLLRQFPVELYYEDERLPQVWAEEVPQIIGHLGTAAIEPLWAVADAADWPPAARSSALIALTYITAVAPEQHQAIVAGLRARLASAGDKQLASYLVTALGNLGMKELYPDVLAMYRAGTIDSAIIPAGALRQMLLSDSSKRLACARHPLWERYDQHGPFAGEREV